MNRKRASTTSLQNTIISTLIARLQCAESQLELLTSEIKSIKDVLVQTHKADETSTPDGFGDLILTPKRSCYEFTMENDYVVVFTDGACERNGKSNAKAGIGVWFGHNHPLNISRPVSGRPTNNTAEIQACIQAIKSAHMNGVRKLRIKTDSEFVIKSMTQWILRWRKNNWKVATGGDVKNKEDFVILDNAIKMLEKVDWVHVDAHVGIEGNEAADRLAKAGAEQYKS